MKKKITDAMAAKAKQYTASMKGGGKKKMTVSDLMGDCKK
jgi:hypothetical protein